MFKARRARFLERIQGGAAIFPSASVLYRSNDSEFEFRQDSDFWYLTGFDEPDAVAVLLATQPKPRLVLFVRRRNPKEEVWTGYRAGVDGAVKRFGADEAFPIDQLDKLLPRLLRNTERVYYRLGRDAAMDRRIVSAIDRVRRQERQGHLAPTAIHDPREVLHEMRLVKAEDELALMRRATDITCAGHRAAMRTARPGQFEYQLEAELEYVFRQQGSPSPGYPSIVGSGPNATILHYNTNRRKIEDGDLVLIDAGAEVEGYSGDVTRTFPVGRSFSRAQAAIYREVLKAQCAVIESVKPGKTFNSLHELAVELLTESMLRLGLLKGRAKKLVKKKAYRAFYMHGTSHWLGMDVHDVGHYRRRREWRKLEPGMILTVEPGIYVAPDAKRVPPKYRGIGVRIEDDILVTAEGHQNLTARAPKEIGEIEELRGRALAKVPRA
ncbi:MAG: Xaa-Pro aminopeptidase [Planctomycetes bacterium]|nr:Xaa-Pro aminopeptidase [Planctomycetota bacterium]